MIRSELEVIAHEGWRLRRLVQALPSLEGGGILGYLLLPTFAFYSVGVCDWFERAGRPGGGQLLREYDRAFRSARARLKIFDDTKLKLLGLQALMDRCDQQSVRHFNQPHSGIAGPIKRWLQDDLGLYFVGPDLVLSTHVALATTSFFESDVLTHLMSQEGGPPPRYSMRIGQFIAGITDALAELAPIPETAGPIGRPEGPLRRQDAKARKLYRSVDMTMRFSGSHAASLSALLSQVNFVQRWGRHLLPADDLLRFRIRYLTAFHALSGVKRLNDSVRGDQTTRIAQIAARLLGSEPGRYLRKLPIQLRNTLAHYSFPEGFALSPTEKGFTQHLVEHCSKSSFDDVDANVDAILEQTSIAFRETIPLQPSAVPIDA